MGFTAVKNTICLSLLEFWPPAINPELVMECTLTLHIKYDKQSTRRKCSESTHFPAVQDQWGCVLNDLAELGSKEFLVLTDQHSIEIFTCCLGSSLPFCSSIHHQTNMLRVLKFVPKITLSVSRIRSPHLLLSVVLRIEEECSVFLPLGTLDRIELLDQYQYIFFQECGKSLKVRK